MAQQENNNLKQFIQNLPKIELHAHINGSISDRTMKKLVAKRREREPDWGKDGQWQVNIEKGVNRTMEDGFVMFANIHKICDNEEAAYMITKDVIEEFAADNVKYLELRTTPRVVPSTGMTKNSYVTTVMKAIREQNDNPALDITVKLLLAIDRRTTLEDAFDTLELAKAVHTDPRAKDILVGLDLSGDPNKGDASVFIPVFQQTKEAGLKLALHIAEVEGKNEETESVLKLPPDRIGHATFLHPEAGGSQEFVDTVLTNQIPIELCITSNLKTSTVQQIDKHQFGFWFNQKHLCTLGTDDKGVFCTSLSEEYLIAANAFELTREQLWDISYSSINFIFAENKVKEKLKVQWLACKEKLFAIT